MNHQVLSPLFLFPDTSRLQNDAYILRRKENSVLNQIAKGRGKVGVDFRLFTIVSYLVGGEGYESNILFAQVNV
jgi:hypothetical protein